MYFSKKPEHRIQKHSFRYISAGGLFTIIIIFTLYSLQCPIIRHEFAFGIEQTSDSIEAEQKDDGVENKSEKASIIDEVFNSTLGFGKVLAVSLPERIDHRDRLILQCAISEIKVEFVDGVHGDTVAEKALPADPGQLAKTEIGSWRAHLNAIKRVVDENLDSALIIEDDVDWDIRIKPLLKNFAISAQAIVSNPADTELYFHDLPKQPANSSTISPYGDNWDLLWLGHCESSLPAKRVIQFHDESVPEPQFLHSWQMSEVTPLSIFPNHTRAVLQNAVHACSLAYAVSQKGARKLQYDMGVKRLSAAFDLVLSRWCKGNGVCVSALPQLFDHHRAKGPMSLDSDIRVKEGTRDQAETLNIRLSVAMNMQKLLDGNTDYDDQYSDTV